MTIDDRLLKAATAAAEQIRAAQRDVETARAGFQRAVRALYLDGGSLREIAEALGLSHQRVHQLLNLPAQPASTGSSVRRRIGGPLFCSFCGRAQALAAKLIAGTGGIAICDHCVALGRSCLFSGESAWSPQVSLAVQPAPGRCPFCGKHTGVALSEDPRTPLALVTAPGIAKAAAICEECLQLCEEIIAETVPPEAP